jgi:hypothetical protein
VSQSEAGSGEVSVRSYLKSKRGMGVAQVVKYLPSKHEALSSIPTEGEEDVYYRIDIRYKECRIKLFGHLMSMG